MSAINWLPSILSMSIVCIHVNEISAMIRGGVSLDSLTLDKVVARFPATLVKFDIQYPYREVEGEYEKVSESVAGIDDILIAEVYIQDYGDYENDDLGVRFGLNRSDFPILMLFKKNDLKNPITLYAKDDFKAYRIKQFLRKHTGIRVPQESSLLDFDELTYKFMDAKISKSEKEKILKEAVKKSQGLSEEEEKAAKIYTQVMEKVIERGNLFVASELERIQNLLTSKITMKTGREMLHRQRILQSFITEETETLSRKTEL